MTREGSLRAAAAALVHAYIGVTRRQSGSTKKKSPSFQVYATVFILRPRFFPFSGNVKGMTLIYAEISGSRY